MLGTLRLVPSGSDFAFQRVGVAARLLGALGHAEQLIEATAGEITRPVVHELRAALADLCGDPDSRDRELAEASRLSVRLGADASRERPNS